MARCDVPASRKEAYSPLSGKQGRRQEFRGFGLVSYINFIPNAVSVGVLPRNAANVTDKNAVRINA